MHLWIMASLAIARKFNASFSHRVASRRLCLSHSTHGPTTLRRRYDALSNCGLGVWSSRTPGCRLRRSSTSPSSMRTPRILT